MSRAVILPTPGDPFLLQYWLKLYRGVWGQEIDRLYVHLNSPAPADVADYMKTLLDKPKISFRYTDRMIDHGEAIKQILADVTEDYVMLVEDDGLIFDSGMVDWCFRQLESGRFDIVGSKRGSCGAEILEVASKKWKIPMDGYGDQGCNFWPCYFFTKTSILRKIENFGAKMWYAGDYVEPLDFYTMKDQAGDTFVEASLILRNMIPAERIQIVPQYHTHPDDITHSEQKQSIWDGMAHWLHIGSLSSGAYNLLDPSRPLPTMPETDFDKREYERRVQWWLTFWEKRDVMALESYAQVYKAGIDRIIQGYNLHMKQIRKRQKLYEEVGLL